MADIKGPMLPGDDNKDIMTSMNPTNVQNKGDGKVEKFKGTMNLDKSGNAEIEGPGMHGCWNAGIKISGTNKKY
jgi:hypothetical protein